MAKASNVVLVHGGFVDGAGWRGVYEILKKDGFNVSIVHNPTISLAGDATATKYRQFCRPRTVTCFLTRPSSRSPSPAMSILRRRLSWPTLRYRGASTLSPGRLPNRLGSQSLAGTCSCVTIG